MPSVFLTIKISEIAHRSQFAKSDAPRISRPIRKGY